jgi:methionine sulfoxide reductase heme-binding subunit
VLGHALSRAAVEMDARVKPGHDAERMSVHFRMGLDFVIAASRSMALVRIATFALLAAPAAILAHDYLAGALASPFRTIVQESGVWSMRLLVLGLLIAPLRDVTGWTWPLALRRMIGLFAAFYAAVHVIAWTRQYGFDWQFLAGEVMRPWPLIGLLGAMAMVPLALTSVDAMHRLLGTAQWRRIHRLVYAAALLGLVHYAMARGLTRIELPIDAALIALALLWRVVAPALPRKRGAL